MPASVLLIEQGGRGGVAEYTTALSGALADLGMHVDVATARDHLHPSRRGVTFHASFPYVRGTTGFRAALRRFKVSKLVNAVGYLAVLPAIARTARRTRLVHLQGGEYPPLDLVLLALVRACGARLVFTPHNTFQRDRSPLKDVAQRVLLSHCSAVIVHARTDLDALSSRARRHATVLPLGEYAFAARTGRRVSRDEARRRLGLASDVPVTLVFGQLRPDKGVVDVLSAAREVEGLHVLIVGQEAGGLAAASELLADDALAGRVQVREGFVAMDEAAVYFAATDTVALAYHQASQSAVLMLAYGFARPPVVYPVGGLPEVVHDGETGWVCTDRSVSALMTALRSAAAGGWPECERRGGAGERYAETELSWSSIARRTAALYEAVGAGAGAARAARPQA